jgi:hypothetical protein
MFAFEARARGRLQELCRARRLGAFVGLVAAVLVVGNEGVAAEPKSVKPESGPWDAGGGFDFATKPKKTRQSVSGIACPAPNSREPRLCLIVFDEGVEARYASVTNNSFAVDGERVVLRASPGELDAEGAATDGRYFYVTGSHSPKRSTCQNNLESRRVIRFAVDPKTGRASREPAGDPNGALVEYRDLDDLWNIMAAVPALKEHVGDQKCLGTEPPEDAPHLKGQRGVNIEGLAVKDGRLLFGFRGPAGNGEAVILSIDAEAFFAGGDPRPETTRITVGDRRGIRDLYATRDAILILAGPDDDPSSNDAGWLIGSWDGKNAGQGAAEPRWIARFDLSEVKQRECDKELKPEALTLLEEAAGHYLLLILSDGMCDGGPLAFKVLR